MSEVGAQLGVGAHGGRRYYGWTIVAACNVTTKMGAVGRAAFTAVGGRWPSRQIAAAMFAL